MAVLDSECEMYAFELSCLCNQFFMGYSCAEAGFQEGEEKTVTIDGFADVEPYSEAALMEAVSKQPVSVAIEASAWDFQLYAEVSVAPMLKLFFDECLLLF